MEKNKKQEKSVSYCSNVENWNNLDSKQLRKKYKALAENKKPGKYICKKAVAQLILESQFASTCGEAVLSCFCVRMKEMSKAQKKIVKMCFNIGQANYMNKLYKTVLVNEKASPVLKVIAEIKGLINDNSIADGIKPVLNVNLTDKKTKPLPVDKKKIDNKELRKLKLMV